jgi:uncharacterized membrane protein
MIAFPLDFVFLRTGRRLFGANARDLILDGATSAILFYVIYIACTVSFVNGRTPNDWVWAAMIPDIVWGATLTALASSAGGLLA